MKISNIYFHNPKLNILMFFENIPHFISHVVIFENNICPSITRFGFKNAYIHTYIDSINKT